MVKESYGEELQLEWEPFLLVQVNSKEGPEWKAWEQMDDTVIADLLAMRAGQAARRQGDKLFGAFQLAMLKARHEDRKELSKEEVIMEAAQISSLDMPRFREDLADKGILKELGDSHTKAVEEYGVFGVPTFIFPSGNSAFLKTFVPPREEAVEVFDALSSVMGKFKYIGEMKRPQPPWPKGVFA